MSNTTIAAISTAVAAAGISVIRVSGPNAICICDGVFRAVSGRKLNEMKGYTCAYGAAYDEDEKIDECIAAIYRAPHSYTGEDVVELSCHGGVYVTKRILRGLFDAGALPAEPGEFTRRAFLNGKIDLVEAESVMDIISARSRSAARAALSVKDGKLSRRIAGVKAALLNKAAHLAAWADYPEEDIPEVESGELTASLENAGEELSAVVRDFDSGRILKDGVDTVIVGKPNVGKSTLMNLLAGYDKSIVTSIAGTTRDIVEESVSLGDIVLNLSDTAGIRSTDDEIERIGVDKARARLDSAALILCVFDSSQELTADDRDIIEQIGDGPAVAVLNKADLGEAVDADEIKQHFRYVVRISAKNGEGLDSLIAAVKDICGAADIDTSSALIYNERQRSLAIKARDCVKEAMNAIDAGVTFDAVTVSIEEAIAALCELTGESVTDEVLDKVFHNFCVGK